MSKIFMSYSHKDEPLRDELELHLSMLKRQGLISTWHDRKILPGDEFENEIDENLESSDIILLLVSPYFLASDYCYEIEMKRAIERHENGEARVIPIILDHCDWKNALFGKLNALPKDGQPISDYPNQNKAFLEIVEGLRKVISTNQSEGAKHTVKAKTSDIAQKAPTTNKTKDPQRSSNLRVKKNFTDKEKDDFLVNVFEYIYKFFKNSLEELEQRNEFIDTNIERIDSQTFAAKVYKEEKLVSQCKVWRGTDFGNTEAIKYSNSISERNSFNMMFTVSDDGYTQYLESSGLHSMYQSQFNNDDGKLSRQGASEHLWAMLVEPLQR
ncbi:toll/interleukin-1 receptor domain-containing protein [Gracilimonas sp.]|uniref:toll/interleukin-1 receptor domain-containing protein n=1 Tax=Gracilimonas sp. TaxID=1974203 RepID=UPI003BA92174